MKNFIRNTGRAALVLCLLFSVFCGAIPVYGEEAAGSSELSSYGVTLFSNNNGIPTGEANAVLQTSEGYIWIGGYGGLLRYDGTSFVQFSGAQTGLTSYSIRALWESPNGMLWVGTNEQGAFYYENGTFHRVGTGADTSCLSIRSFGIDAGGTVWIGATDGLFYVADGQPTAFDLTAFGKTNSTVYTLSYSDGALWGVDNAGAVFAVDPEAKTLLHYYAPGELWDADLYAYSALADQGTLYVGTGSDAIVVVDLARGSSEILRTGGLSAINSICKTDSGALWFCGDNGIGMIESGVYSDLSYLEQTEHLLCVTEDYEHNIWAASSKYGVLHLIRNKIRNLSAISGMDNTETYVVKEIDGLEYIGSEAGLIILDENWLPVENALTAELSGMQVHHIARDTAGKIYIGTYYNGLYMYDPASGAYEKRSVSGNRIRMLLPLADGTVAIASNAGVDFLRDGELTANYNDFGPTHMILCMAQQPDGTLLCGSDGGGVYAIRDGAVTPYANTTNGLSGGVILRIVCDDAAPEHVWISCGNDVFYGDGTAFSPVSTLTEGNGSVLDIFPDGEEVWLFRSSGLLRFDREALLSGAASASANAFFGENAGLPGTIVANSWSAFDGHRIIACTNNGIGVLDVDDIYTNTVAPKGAVTAIQFSDGTVWDGADTVRVNSDLTKISISVAALTYMKSNATIRYKMDGIDSEYIEKNIGSQHEIEYTNLAAGTYAFHMQVFNGDKTPSEEYTVTFIKEPHFVETVWFMVLLVLVSVLLTAGVTAIITKVRMHRLHERQKFYQSITEQSIETIAGAIDAKDPYTNGHSRRVSEFSVKIAQKMKLPQEDCERLAYIALLHDIGKIGVPDQILKKAGKLTDEEFAIIKQHPAIGGEILHNFTALKGVAEGAEFHHERYDGKGYCKGLAGVNIPLFARIIGVADAYDAMNSDRCYRKALPKEVILSELEKGRGKQFDPAIADVAIGILKAEK